MAFSRIKDIVDAEINGQVRNYGWRKTPSQSAVAGQWFDLSMSPGNPPPKYWFDAPPGVAKAVYQSTDGGLYHGANAAPSNKYLRSFSVIMGGFTNMPCPLIICDYLLYYPSLDDSTVDPQILDNTITLPRYTDGKGVQMLAVSVAGRTGGQQFYVTYTNSEGVSGRVSQTVTQNASAVIGNIVTSATAVQASGNPFIGLAAGDSGVRSVESITMLGADVGLFSLILVKPLGITTVRDGNTITDKDFLIQAGDMPIIKDNAFLGLLTTPQGNLSGALFTGDIKVTWD